MFGFLKKLFSNTDAATLEQAGVKIEQAQAPYKVEPPVVAERAEDSSGKFVADNPATPENESWAPALRKAMATKAPAKKATAKKPAAKAAPRKKK